MLWNALGGLVDSPPSGSRSQGEGPNGPGNMSDRMVTAMRRWRLGALTLLLAFIVSPMSGGVAQASSLADLSMQGRLVSMELRQAKASKSQARSNLVAQKLAYRNGYHALQAASVAIWMGIPSESTIDAASVDGIKEGIATARNEVAFASQEVNRLRLQMTTLRAQIKAARTEARLERQRAKMAAYARQEVARASSTIACPVQQISAIYSDFGADRPGGPHRGIDIPAPMGTPVFAAWQTLVKETPTGGWMGKGVVLEDGSGNTWWYAHLSRIDVKPGQLVARGQQIGAVGSTGNSSGPHLHFEIHARGITPVDPYTLVSPACGVADPMTHAERVAYESDDDLSADQG